jgi:hypothetical protein
MQDKGIKRYKKQEAARWRPHVTKPLTKTYLVIDRIMPQMYKNHLPKVKSVYNYVRINLVAGNILCCSAE